MKTKLILALTSLLYLTCEKSEIIPSDTFQNKIIGDWLLVSEKQKLNSYLITEDDNGIMGYWAGNGISWVGNIEFNRNKTVNINHFGIDGPANGTWKLENKTITFFTETEYVGLLLRDTIQFEISIDESERLVLENDQLLLKHRKLN